MAYATVDNPDTVAKVKLYTGTGSENAITGVGFAPALTMIKSRDGTPSWVVVDKVRGATKRLKSDQDTAEGTETQMVKTLDSDGFTLGTTSTSNANGTNFFSLNFKGNGSGSSNSDGSVTSTVSANTSKTFSVVKWTGTGANATVGHGLTTKPVMIWVKRTDASSNWKCYHREIGPDWTLKLNTNDVRSQETNWQDTHPTTSVFYVGSGSEENNNGSQMIAYCFGEADGCTKGGSWRPTGQAGNGGFIHTGFAPEIVIYKRYTQAGGNWGIHDRTRRPKNVNGYTLQFDTTGAEFSYENNSGYVDMLSNGFNLYGTSSSHNDGSSYYIYYAIGRPLVGTNDIPSNAR
jgi:hypothetical protein|tara:strand:+ start:2180 stop:3220 length:1041 start_codon:yes stop_codon:yes gene_type:complete